MLIAYIILFTASLLVVGAIWCAYEIGKSVGTFETQRNYRFPNYKITTESRK
jgi:hypothetical protein